IQTITFFITQIHENARHLSGHFFIPSPLPVGGRGRSGTRPRTGRDVRLYGVGRARVPPRKRA
ncbi:MAG: hypothetical protein RR212_09340, partial [Bacteroidales bacterium]